MGRAWDLEPLRRQREKTYPLNTERLRLPCLVGGSDCPHLTGLRTLGTLGDLEFHLLVLFKAAEASAVDLRVVHEDVWALGLRDEAETFFGVEPLHSSLCHFCFSFVRDSGPRHANRQPDDQTATSGLPCKEKETPAPSFCASVYKTRTLRISTTCILRDLPTLTSIASTTPDDKPETDDADCAVKAGRVESRGTSLRSLA